MTSFLVFLLAYLLSQFFRSFLAVISPDLVREIGLTAADLGAISGSWFAAFALFQFAVGWGLDRLGPRRTVTALMLFAVAGCLLFSAAQTASACIAAMVLIGIGCSPIYMGALYLFGRTMRVQRFALLSSWMLGLGSFGNLLAATPLAIASATVGWRDTFQVLAVITLASALLVWLLVRDPPPAERPMSVTRPPSLAGELKRVLAIRALWPLLPLVAVSYAVAAVERGLWVGPYLSSVHGLSGVDLGNGVLWMAIAMSAGALVYGPLDQLFATRKWVVFAGTLLTICCLAVLALVPALTPGSTIAMLTAMGFVSMTYAVLMAHARGFLPDDILGRGITFVNFLFIGGSAALQLASGHFVAALVASGHTPAETYATLHGAFALLLLAAAAVYLFSRDTQKASRS